MVFLSHGRAWLDEALAAVDAAKVGPTAADLTSAPVIEGWRPVLNGLGILALQGFVRNHPRLGSRVLTTSALIALVPRAGWSRTVSRLYKLGQGFTDYSATSAPFASFPKPAFPVPTAAEAEEHIASFIARLRRWDTAEKAQRAVKGSKG